MKIIQVINAMIANKSKITNVTRNDKEYFFLYDKKHKWSIIKRDAEDEYILHFYPTDDMTYEQLVGFTDWQNFSGFVTYQSQEIKTKEAIESFSELYQIVAGRVFGLDEIFDEIINS